MSRNADRIARTTRALLASARRSFAAQGYAATSMEALCAEVGLTRGALYHHFGGKEGLLEAVVREIDAETNARLDAAYEAGPGGWAGFRDCCQAYLDLALEPEYQRVMLRDAPAVLGQRHREIDAAGSLQPIIDGLADLMDEGALRRTDPEALARMLNGGMIDAALWIAAHDDPPLARERAREVLDRLLDGLQA